MNTNKIISFAVSCALMSCVCAHVQYTSAETNAISLGDVNGDGLTDAVDASDVLAEYALVSGGQAPSFSDDMKKAADVNRDGLTDAVDASQILAYYAYLSTGGKLGFEEYLSPQPVTTTSTVTSTTVTSTTTVTTTRPVTTTTVRVTQPPVTTVPYIKRTYNKYDILSDDPYEAKFALSQLANQLGAELYNGYNPVNQYGFLLAEAAAYAIIVDLNYNQGINIKALGDAYGLLPEDEFLSECDNLDLAHYQYFYSSKVDWTKYVLDENLANFINTVSDEYKEYMNGNTEPLMNEINDYFANNSIDIDNYAKYYFMCNTKNPEDYYRDEMNEGREIFINNVAKPLYDEICQNKVILQIRG
ncbi:MAG: hypothetical protein IKH78_10095 [Ruminococcus sp.]|nr:hypothetical protein [Ruminococcus sp.]